MIDVSKWPSEAEAASMLGTSIKTIIRYAAAGKIETRKRPRPGKKPENVCNPRDIEKLLPTAHVMPVEAEDVTATIALRKSQSPNGNADGAALLAFIRTIATAIETERQIAQMPRLWLTLEEARSYSGRSRSWLLRMCREGRLVAEKDGGWKIRRESLEGFEG
jgi:hypothetical protein